MYPCLKIVIDEIHNNNLVKKNENESNEMHFDSAHFTETLIAPYVFGDLSIMLNGLVFIIFENYSNLYCMYLSANVNCSLQLPSSRYFNVVFVGTRPLKTFNTLIYRKFETSPIIIKKNRKINSFIQRNDIIQILTIER